MPRAGTPPHFTALSVVNFRSFKNSGVIPLGPLTIVVGENSAGKSTIANAIMFLIQSGLLRLSGIQPNWTGALADLGSFSDAVYGHQTKKHITISLSFSGLNRRSAIKHTFRIVNSKDPLGIVSTMELCHPASGYYVSAKRGTGRRKAYTLTSTVPSREKIVWTAREEFYRSDLHFAVRYLLEHNRRSGKSSPEQRRAISALMDIWRSYRHELFIAGTQRVASGRLPPERWYARRDSYNQDVRLTFDRVDPSLLSRVHEGRRARSIAKTLSEFGLAKSIRASNLSAYHTSILVEDPETNIEANLTDVGYGVSQAIPIARAVASGLTGPLFVEQPEIHLHPAAQASVARVLASISRQRQVIIETHSDRVINTVRIMAARKEIDSRTVQIIYVSKTKTGSRITPISIDSEGSFLNEWPQGFFDERFADTMALAQMKEG